MALALTLTDERCQCGDYLWSRPVDGDDPLLSRIAGCPTCDRPRCRNCRSPHGLLLAPAVEARWGLPVYDDLCEPCLTERSTDLEDRQAA